MLAHSHKPAGPQAQMSLGGAMAQQPQPQPHQQARSQVPQVSRLSQVSQMSQMSQAPLAGGQHAPTRLQSNLNELPVSYYQPQQQAHYPIEQAACELGAIGRRTGQPAPQQQQLVYGPGPQTTNGNYQQQQQPVGYSSGPEMGPLAAGGRQQSPYLQQQQQPQPIPVRHQQEQQQRGYARQAPLQPQPPTQNAPNFNSSVNTSQVQAQQHQHQHQLQQVQHQAPHLLGADLNGAGGDAFAPQTSPLLQQQLNRHRPAASQQHEPMQPAHYQLDGPIQQQQAAHANFAYGPPVASHKQRSAMQQNGPLGGPLRAQQQQQRQQVIASATLQQQQLDLQPQQFPCNPTPPLTPNRLAAGAAPAPLPHQHQDDWSHAYSQPANGLASYHQEPAPSVPAHQLHQQPAAAAVKHRIHQMPKSQQSVPVPYQRPLQPHESAGQIISHKRASSPSEQPIRLTLPLRDLALVGPFKLEHEVQFASKSFHLRPQLFEQLSKAASAYHRQTAAVIQELQFRAYLSTEVVPAPAQAAGSNSLLAANQQQQRPALTNSCQWPEMFQVSCNQQLVHLDRSVGSPAASGSGAQGGARLAHRALDLFPYCQPGDNLLELEVHGCYCSHEYVLELVDRPTLKAFMNSCFKTRLLASEACLAKLAALFGKAGFSCQLPAAGIINEYVTEYLIQPNGQQVEQTRLKISLRCPLSGRRMRTPTRGPNCKHLQCFDLETFLLANRERTRWSCPICALPVPFNMLELDQHQMNICQSMASLATRADEVLVNNLGHWQAYQASSPPPLPAQVYQPAVKANNANFQQQPTGGPGALRLGRGAAQPAQWDHQQQMQQQQQQRPQMQSASPPAGAPVRRSLSAIASHPAAPKAKRPLNSTANPNANKPPPAYQQQNSGAPLSQMAPQVSHQGHQTHAASLMEPPMSQASQQALEAELSPLAAMERTIIHHEQQMGPPPFDANILGAASSPSRASSASGQPAALSASPSAGGAGSGSFASPHHHQHQPSPPESAQLISQHQAGLGSSPLRQVAASPQQANATQVPQPSSTPATPLHHVAPETPATPGQPASMQPQLQANQQQQHNVDHQPLSNGSASAASITSTSTLTPSGQSLGSVGMGGDSRCNTAPLQNALGSLEDLVQVPAASGAGQPLGGSPSAYASKQQMAPMAQLDTQQQQQPQLLQHFDERHLQMNSAAHFDGSGAHSACGQLSHRADRGPEKGNILMSKLMMEPGAAGESGQQSELALALEEAEWKQQLDRGKSEHLANFLNEPTLMNPAKRQHHLQHSSHFSASARPGSQLKADGASKPTSARLNASDDDQLSPARAFNVLGSPTSDLLADQLDQQHQHSLDPYANYLDSNGADDGAGLPPDDSILDLFER